MKYFETIFLEEANKFIAKLDSKTVRKIFYNMILRNKPTIQNFSRSCKAVFGSFEQDTRDFT